jgi:carbonic anhydrase
MTCQNATGPVNIVPTKNTCFNKCRFGYNFTKTGVNTSHKSDYISIVPNDRNTPNVTYSSSNTGSCRNGGEGNYAVDDIRIHHPSLHTYGKKQVHAMGELVIHLNNVSGGRNLIICIAITNKNGSQPLASEQLTQIVEYLSKMGNSSGEGGTVQGLNFDMNSFIPTKGFYAYTASLPTPPCTKCTDYIVYDLHDAAISLDNSVLRQIKNLIAVTYTQVQPITRKIGYAYNKRGAQHGAITDAIWIDCQPTGADGKTLIEENKQGVLTNDSFRMFNNMSDDQRTTLIAVGVAALFTLRFYVFKGLPKRILKSE